MFAGVLIQSRVWLTPAAMATAAATASFASGFVEGETSVTRRRSSDGSLPILVYVYAPSSAPSAAPLMTSGSTRSRLTTTWSGEAGSRRARALTPLPTARRTCSGVTSTSPRPTMTASASRGTDFDRDTETTNITFRACHRAPRPAGPQYRVGYRLGLARTGLDHA